MTAAYNTHTHIAEVAIREQPYLGNESMSKKGQHISRLMACFVSNHAICMNCKEIHIFAFPISHGFLIEHLYKGYKRYMVTPVTPIRVLYTHVRARKGESL